MSSFHELSRKLNGLRHRRAVLLMLIDHLDKNFIQNTAPAKLSIKTDEGDMVPETEVEKVGEDLSDQIRAVEAQISAIMSSNLEPPQAAPSPAPAEAPKATKAAQGETK